MRVIICGAGQVGFGIAERLAAENNDVTIIDNNPELVLRANDVLDVRAIQGHGAHPDVLARAGADATDMLIAVTLYDEVNMVACQVANTLFNVPTRIARVRAQTYLDKNWAALFSGKGLGIDYIISPEIAVGNAVLRRLKLPGAFETYAFADDNMSALGISCKPDCPVVDTDLAQLAELFPDLPATVVAIVRGGEMRAAHKSDRLLVGDDVYVVVPNEYVPRTLKIFGHSEVQARRVVIAGGGNIGLYVARAIEQREPNVRVKVIETSRDRAVEVAELLGRTVVLNGSSLSEDLLREAEVHATETLVALTNDDQVNILTSVLAKQLGCERAICLATAPGYTKMIRSFGIDAQVNPRAITTSNILQYVRRGKIRGVHAVQNGRGELLEAEALETSEIVAKPLRDLHLPDGIRIGGIWRGGKAILVRGDTELAPKDRVIMFSPTPLVRQVEQMFRVAPDYGI
ncbi:MAG: Trk system potassium transporter TrkA [Pseudomonadota bacterium]